MPPENQSVPGNTHNVTAARAQKLTETAGGSDQRFAGACATPPVLPKAVWCWAASATENWQVALPAWLGGWELPCQLQAVGRKALDPQGKSSTRRHVLAREQCGCSAGEHKAQETVHGRFSLDVERQQSILLLL